jgi:hypothetical protein
VGKATFSQVHCAEKISVAKLIQKHYPTVNKKAGTHIMCAGQAKIYPVGSKSQLKGN